MYSSTLLLTFSSFTSSLLLTFSSSPAGQAIVCWHGGRPPHLLKSLSQLGEEYRLSLEAERNSFLLYLRGEVFVRWGAWGSGGDGSLPEVQGGAEVLGV